MSGEIGKRFGELSDEMKKKARACKTPGELRALLAGASDAALSDEALEEVSGGGLFDPSRCPCCIYRPALPISKDNPLGVCQQCLDDWKD